MQSEREIFESIVKRYSTKKARKELYLDLIDVCARKKEHKGSFFICNETIDLIGKKEEETYSLNYNSDKLSEIIPEYFLFNDSFSGSIWFNYTCEKHGIGYGVGNGEENRMLDLMNDMRLSALMFCVEMCK